MIKTQEKKSEKEENSCNLAILNSKFYQYFCLKIENEFDFKMIMMMMMMMTKEK